MTRLAKQLPEYDTVLAMYGVGETTAAQLMAEIGMYAVFPAAALSLALQALIQAWMIPASTVPRAFPRPSADHLI